MGIVTHAALRQALSVNARATREVGTRRVVGMQGSGRVVVVVGYADVERRRGQAAGAEDGISERDGRTTDTRSFGYCHRNLIMS